eukprot:contig_42077_g9538
MALANSLTGQQGEGGKKKSGGTDYKPLVASYRSTPISVGSANSSVPPVVNGAEEVLVVLRRESGKDKAVVHR